MKKCIQKRWNLDRFIEEAKLARGHQSTSQGHEGWLQDLKDKPPTTGTPKKWQGARTKNPTQEVTAPTTRKARWQARRKTTQENLQLCGKQTASANVMDAYQFKALWHRSQEIKELSPNKDTLKTLQSADLMVNGEFPVILPVEQEPRSKEKFSGDPRQEWLPTTPKLLELGMLKIDPEGTLRETNIENNCRQPRSTTRRVQRSIWRDSGRFRNKNTGREIEAKLEMVPEAIPGAQNPRPVAYHLQEPLKKWLEQGVKEEIFEKVPEGEPITWCSPLVVQPKSKYTIVKKEELEAQMIRASIDMRIPDESMKRRRCVQSPRV